MKKIITIMLSFLFVSLQSANAELGIGISGALHNLEASGTHTLRQSAATSTASTDEKVFVGELFIEAFSPSGHAIGISYTPTREIGNKSRTDTTTSGDAQDTGTYTAKAELTDVAQVYAELVAFETSGISFYGKAGIQHATIKTLETLNSGSSFPDKNVFGTTLGLGIKGDLPFASNMYAKLEGTMTDFDDYDATSKAGNTVKADLESKAARFSIGYKF